MSGLATKLSGSLPALGATPDSIGVTFAVSSHHAEAVELCLFESSSRLETARLPLMRGDQDVWSVRIEGIGAGQLYGYRAHGPYDPPKGHRFSPNKLLIDPWARLLDGPIRWGNAAVGDGSACPDENSAFDPLESTHIVPLSVVVDSAFDWRDDRAPLRSWSETLVYEAHVKGLTLLHPEVPSPLRGTYEALGHPAVVAHLLRLGVTALELMPIHAFADDQFLVRRGLRNFWGYSSLGFCAPEARYLGPAGIPGLKGAIAALHQAGIEVILDVVYNHTAEAEETGPTLSFRGFDNASYYKAVPGHPGRTWNPTGCGNAFDLSNSNARRTVLESLRLWVNEYHVDGFRFDLAPTLARNPYDFDPNCAFLREVAADPVLSGVKLIAEPWDIGPGGYQLGAFPPGWSDWNDSYRDTLRGFWRGDRGQVPKLARALSGSREIFEPGGRGPEASINYVCSHDGFTLADLVSYEERHNWANGEGNRDGHAHELSVNHGAEGPTEDPAIRGARARHVRNLLATLLLSQGVPMLLMGDERGRTQGGNNNAYCQDNETTWLDWSEPEDPALPGFVAALQALRRRHPALRRTAFLTGERDPETGLKDVYWLAPDAREMAEPDWTDDGRCALGMQLGNGPDEGGRLLVLLNAGDNEIGFRLSPDLGSDDWLPAFSTTVPGGVPDEPGHTVPASGTFLLPPRSVVLFRAIQHTG